MRLQKAPTGILELFGIKSEGRNPADFGETVLPVIDVAEFYGPLLPTSTIGAPSVGSPFATASVPRTSAGWRVFSMGGSAAIPAGTTFPDGMQMVLQLNTSPGTSTVIVAASPLTPPLAAFAAAGSFSWGIAFPKPLVLQPGASWTAVMGRAAVNAVTVTVNGSVQDLPTIS